VKHTAGRYTRSCNAKAWLPVQAPAKYELVINLKTGDVLGLDVLFLLTNGRRRNSALSALTSNLLQNFFGTQAEEHFFKTSPRWRILIQEIAIADSIIAHFRRSHTHWQSFATGSLQKRANDRRRPRSALCHELP
jgi:hypothetical protein